MVALGVRPQGAVNGTGVRPQQGHEGKDRPETLAAPAGGEVVTSLRTLLAVDFETADRLVNGRCEHACSAGVALIRDGRIVLSRGDLIRPSTPIHPDNERFHGVTNEAVAGAEPFAAWHAALLDLIETHNVEAIIAHNASFDRHVLEAECARNGLESPGIGAESWICTVEAARQAWPSLKSHSLGALAETFGFDLVHHDAHSDAVTCALMYLASQQVRTLRANGDAAIRVASVFAAGTRAVRAA